MGNEHCFRASSDIRSEMGSGPSYKTSKRRVVSVIVILIGSCVSLVPSSFPGQGIPSFYYNLTPVLLHSRRYVLQGHRECV
jgi:hypothetical protein